MRLAMPLDRFVVSCVVVLNNIQQEVSTMNMAHYARSSRLGA